MELQMHLLTAMGLYIISIAMWTLILPYLPFVALSVQVVAGLWIVFGFMLIVIGMYKYRKHEQ